MSSWLYLLFFWGIYLILVYTVNGESQICGYSGDSFLCCSGYKKDDQGECTLPICENDCGIGGECIRPDKCYCANGRVAPSCPDDTQQNNDDFEKKIEKPGICSNNCNGQGLCVNGKCQCNLGHSGYSCLDKLVDQCYLSLVRGICQKNDNEIKLNIEQCCGAFDVAWGDPCQKCPRSRCQKGYMEIDGACQDINECNILHLCRNGRCENFEGSYKCLCSTGYQFDYTKGDCIKIKDVCKHLPKVCGDGMKCLTLSFGNYRCQCLDGYTKAQDLKSCVRKVNKFNFCAIYGTYVCQSGQCKPDGNNYKCECDPGYRLSGDLKSCKKNIDYCALYHNVLCLNGLCVSVGDDYMCKCNAGYTPSFNRKKCTSVCDLYPTSLCPNAQCIPQEGGNYECRCNEGYAAIGKGKQCRRIMNDQSAAIPNSATIVETQSLYDVDYCSYDYYNKQCLGGRCINKQGYYQCECLHGYVTDKNGLACKKIDNSVSGQMLDMAGSIELKSYCDKYGSFLCTNGHCMESGSSYQCRCNSGYQESIDGKSCYDIDECSVDSTVCAQGTCTNSPGSYQCSCYDGFTIHYVPGGPKCYDRNECEEDQLLCTNGRCTNKWGSYSCSCNSGYKISNDGKQCVPLKFETDSQIKELEVQCKDCKRACKKLNSTSILCECSNGLSPVLNTGLCAPMSQVIDIQFDFTIPTNRRTKRTTQISKQIFFELITETNKETFLKQISSRFRSTVVNQCEPVEETKRNGILCSYYMEQ